MKPIYIGGCPRSGTTMLGSILGGHPNILCVPEGPFIFEFYPGNGTLNKNEITRIINKVSDYWRFKIWDVKINLGQFLNDSEINSYADIINRIVIMYGDQIGRSDFDSWVDHSPGNVQFAINQFELFPKAKMIHIVRDGRGVASSLIPLDWGPNTVLKAADWWTRYVSYGLAAESFFGESKVFRVHYEDLLQEPETTMQAVCNFLDISFDNKMLGTASAGFEVPEYTQSQHQLVGKGLDKKKSTAWRDKLTSREIQIFEIVTGDLLPMLGYEKVFGSNKIPISRIESLEMNGREIYRKFFVNKTRSRSRKRLIGAGKYYNGPT